jgi:hypothetical protein
VEGVREKLEQLLLLQRGGVGAVESEEKVSEPFSIALGQETRVKSTH